jgi:hypothetical protein
MAALNGLQSANLEHSAVLIRQTWAALLFSPCERASVR